MNKLRIFTILIYVSLILFGCKDDNNPVINEDDEDNGNETETVLAERNMLRAMELADSTLKYTLSGSRMAFAEFYNPYFNVRSENIGGVWMYSSIIEGINALLNGLQAHKNVGDAKLYADHFNRFSDILYRLYDNLNYYEGPCTVTSFTQTKEWYVYAVHRGNGKGTANTDGNVYDDQQWLIIELLQSYKITGEKSYLDKAEYLTEYVLDGWDCTLDENGNEHGGILWGYTHTTKHACSNGPMVSPLVWLYELYKDKDDEISYKYIDSFQKNLDYGYENYLKNGFLPHDLLSGWNSNPQDNYASTMFAFAFIAEYANLARYELEKDKSRFT